MLKQGCLAILLLLFTVGLTGCLSDVWTGASLVYDRHNVYKKLSDFQLAADASRALYHDKLFKQPGCAIDLAIINGDILLAGHVPTIELRQEAYNRVYMLGGYRHIFDQLAIGHITSNTMQDDWITAKIRSQIFADAQIDPHVFKVVTSDQIVYLMGDVIPEQATRVIYFARSCEGVKRVVKLFRYYNLSDHPELATTKEKA